MYASAVNTSHVWIVMQSRLIDMHRTIIMLVLPFKHSQAVPSTSVSRSCTHQIGLYVRCDIDRAFALRVRVVRRSNKCNAQSCRQLSNMLLDESFSAEHYLNCMVGTVRYDTNTAQYRNTVHEAPFQATMV